MWNVYVQLIRNALCCIKDLHLFRDTVLWDPSLTVQMLATDLPSPMNQTTPLEVIISITQFYAFCSLSISGIAMMYNNRNKLVRIQRLMEKQQQPKQQSNNDTDNISKKDDDSIVMETLIRESLQKEQDAASSSIYIGFFILFLGLSFFWLVANSWHISETNWIGGWQGLIHALTVGEVSLAYLLMDMFRVANQHFDTSEQLQVLADKMRMGNVRAKDLQDLVPFQMASQWTPFWASSSFLSLKEQHYEKLMMDEKKHLQDQIAWFILKEHEQDKLQQQKDNNNKTPSATNGSVTTTTTVATEEGLESLAFRMYGDARVMQMEGYREFFYFFLNCIAFYGYALGILVFYWNKEEEHPFYIRQAVMGMKNSDAEWRGNFAGDLMWTIEPIFVLLTPIWFNALRPKTVPRQKTQNNDKSKDD